MTEQEFGRYRLLTLLGRGGMGEVWRAVDTDKDREVALKVLGSWLGGDPDFAARFRRESALAARLNSPNIVPIHDYGEIDGRLYIDMPLVDGTDLGGLLAHGPLAPARAVGIIAQAARALGAAHRAGLVHRDVKPSNILVSTTDDGDDHAYLIDFGITKALDGTRLSMSGTVIGTPAYMAPECFVGDGDSRSDVYSLGCVLHETLTGQPPFAAPHAFAYANLHQNAAPPHPSSVNAGVPAELDEVVAQALAKSPDDRFGTTADLSLAARSAVAGRSAKPTVTTPPPPPPTLLAPAPSGHDAAGPGLYGSPVVPQVRWSPPARPPAGRRPAKRRSASGPVERRVLRHHGAVFGIATAEIDGRPVAVTGSSDGTVRGWDMLDGVSLGPPLPGHTGPVPAVATVRLDGRPVAVTGSHDHTVRVWDLTTGTSFGRPLTGHTAEVLALATAQVGARTVAVSGGADRTLRVWDLATGAALGPPLTGHSGRVSAVATAQLDGSVVAVTIGDDRAVRIWDLGTGRPLNPDSGASDDTVRALAVSRLDGRPVIVTGSDDGTARIWNLGSGAPLGRPLSGHTRAVLAVAATELTGRPIAVTGSRDGTARGWDLLTGNALRRTLTGHTDRINAVATAVVEGRPVAVTGSSDNTARVWDLLIAAGL